MGRRYRQLESGAIDGRKKMQKKIQIFIRQYHMIEENDHVAVGVSGGADSVCLLHLLCELRKCMHFRLTAVHVEHGIRGAESLADAAFVRQLCADWNVPLHTFSVDALHQAKTQHQSLEEAARELRYRCFYEACRKCGANRLAVAHHGDDCAETVLFHLSRGTGLRGLCGIVPVRELPEQKLTLIRPLLCVTKAEIEAYLEQIGQEYRTDSTNADVTMSRNRIRSQVLPQLCEVNTAAVPHIVRTAGYLEEICEYLDEAAWDAGSAYITYEREKNKIVKIRLQRQGILAMPTVLQKNLIHRLLGELAGSKKDLTAAHMESVQALFTAQVGKSVCLPYGIRAYADYEQIVLQKEFGQKKQTDQTDRNNRKKQSAKNEAEKKTREYELVIPGECILESGEHITTKILEFDGNFQQIPEKTCTKWFDYDKIKDTVQIRTRRPGDYLQVQAAGGHKKLKDYLINSKIPKEERDQLLLLAEGSHILWVIGQRISEAYKVTQKTKHIFEVCIHGGKEKNE
jgi:tRNA(Ile)-lysidine synthase